MYSTQKKRKCDEGVKIAADESNKTDETESASQMEVCVCVCCDCVCVVIVCVWS